MDEQYPEVFLSLSLPTERCAWLGQHVPTKDEAFLQALRDEARHRKHDNPHTALQVAQAIGDAADVWQDQATQAAAWHDEAAICRVLSDHKKALDLFEKAAQLYRSLDLELEAAQVAVGQFDTLMHLGRYQEALDLANWAGTVFKAFDDRAALGRITMNRGNLLLRLGRLAEARASHAEARTIFTELQDDHHLAMVNVNDAVILIDLNDFRQAEDLFHQARAYFAAEGMTSLVAQVDHNLAFLYAAQGDYQQALATFNRARKTFALQNNAVQVANVDLYRSDIYLALNLWNESLQLVQEARPIFEEVTMQWETALLWLNEAVAVAHRAGELSHHHALEQARKIFAREHYTIWLAMTDLYQAVFDWHRGELASARSCALRAEEAFGREGLYSRAAQCEVVLGELALLENDVAKATACFQKGLDWLKEIDVPAVAFGCWFGLGRAEEYLDRPQQALDHYRRSVANVERLQTAIGAEDYKMAFLSDKLQVYEALILLCLRLDTRLTRQEAFETLEKAKSRTLLDTLAQESQTVSPSSTENELPAQIEQIKRELNWYYNRLYQPQPDDVGSSPENVAHLTKVVTEREQTLDRLLKQWNDPDLATAPNNPVWIVTPEQIQAALPPDSLLLEFYTTEEQVIVFGLTQDGMWTRHLPASGSDVAAVLAQFRFQINKFSYGPAYRQRHLKRLQYGTDAILKELYQQLLAPVADRLTGIDTLIIVPHGILHYVPFQALFDGKQYLIDTLTISYAPSATVLHRLLTNDQNEAGEPPLILGLSDPTLPHVQAEAQTIAALFPEAEIYLENQVTAENLMYHQHNSAFLHLATHATFRADNPLFSALKLADGWLNVQDIYTMPTCAPLVTLSACETGRSQVAVGDELVGLSRGFFAAGAKSLVVSLWLADDESTSRLMVHFYQALQTGLPVNEALRSAQLAIKGELNHPYYWAAFVLTGHPHTCLPATVRQTIDEHKTQN